MSHLGIKKCSDMVSRRFLDATVSMLQKEIEELKEDLEKEKKVVDFYADEFNWHESIEGTRVFDRTSVSDVGHLIGGRVARQRQRERKE